MGQHKANIGSTLGGFSVQQTENETLHRDMQCVESQLFKIKCLFNTINVKQEYLLHAKWSSLQSKKQNPIKLSAMLGEDEKIIPENSDQAN